LDTTLNPEIAADGLQETVRALMQRSGVAFGTSGARGLVSDMSDDVCAAYVLAFIEMLRRAGLRPASVAVGMDLRPSSPRIAEACIAAIEQCGLQADWCGVLPTPALALHAIAHGVPAVMVSGSHIPFDRNGLKFYRPDGEISKADEAAMLSVDLAMPSVARRALPAVNPAALEAYAERALRAFPANMLQGRRIGLYEHSSVSRDVLGQVLRAFGAETVSLGRTDQFVPIDTEAVTQEDAERGIAWAREHRLDAILSTDGDGDRPLVAGEDGVWLRGDIVGLLCARELGIEALAVPVSCNSAIESSGAFAEVLRTRIGSPHVIAGMEELQQRHRRVAGFEANGGFLLGCAVESAGGELAALPTRDAVLPALAVLAAAHRAGCPVSRVSADLPRRYTASDRLQNVPTEQSRERLARWAADPAAFISWLDLGLAPPASMDLTDGLRIALGNGEIVHLRPSGNAPELRCYCEADGPGRVGSLVQAVLGRLKT
jgi:phosphomannomutase